MKILALVLALTVAGCCAPQKIVYEDRIVTVPEIVLEKCPEPPVVVPFRDFPTDSLHANSRHTEIARAYVKSVELCKIKLKQYETALDSLADEPE